MSHLSLVLASPFRGFSEAGVARIEHGVERMDATLLPGARLVHEGETSQFGDCTLPAGIASMEHWLDLNA